MTTQALIMAAGQSLFIPITSTGVVPSQYLGKMTAWTWLGNNYAVPPLVYRRSPWQPVRQTKGPIGLIDAVGYDASMTKRLTETHDISGGLIQVAFGATSLAVDWLPPVGPMWVQLTQEINFALASTRSPVGPATNLPVVFCWDQGQTDAISNPQSAAYGANFATFVAALRAFLAPRTVHFVVLQLSTNAVNPILSAPPANVAAIRAAQAAFVAGDGGLSALVDDSAFATFDGIHLTENGSIQQGEAVADAIAALLGV